MSSDFVRYTVKLPVDVKNELSTRAKISGISMLDYFLRIIRLGLWIANETANSNDAELIIRVGDQEKTVVPFLN